MLGHWIEQIRTEHLTVILDACFSGTGTRTDRGLRVKSVELGFECAKHQAHPPNVSAPPLPYMLIAGSAPEQYSHLLDPADGKGSVLTTFLSKALRESPYGVTYHDVMAQVVPKVEAYAQKHDPNSPQTPQIEGHDAQSFFGQALESSSTSSDITARYHDFDLRISTDQREYREGERMAVTVQADKACYLRLYLINAKQEIIQLFPNQFQQDNFIHAGQPVQIPGSGARFELVMTPPFGTETLKAVASTVQFEDLPDENWQGKSFLDFGKMPLLEMDNRGVAVREISDVEISQAVMRYQVRAR